jgi:hypothetical protein
VLFCRIWSLERVRRKRVREIFDMKIELRDVGRVGSILLEYCWFAVTIRRTMTPPDSSK